MNRHHSHLLTLLTTFLLALPAQAATEFSGNVQAARQAEATLKNLYCGKFAPKGVPCKVNNVRRIGDWAWYSWTMGEAGGDAIARLSGGSWKLVTHGGGVMIVQNGIEAGVPRDIAEFLIPIWMMESEGKLDANELKNLSAWELLVLRNSIYARHGRRFSTKRLQDYFLTWPWYKPNPKYSDALLSALEQENVRIIMQVEKQKGYM